MKEFVTTAMNAIADFDIDSLDTSAADIQSIEITPNEAVEVRQGTTASLPPMSPQTAKIWAM